MMHPGLLTRIEALALEYPEVGKLARLVNEQEREIACLRLALSGAIDTLTKLAPASRLASDYLKAKRP